MTSKASWSIACAITFLNAHRKQLDALVEALLLRETLNEQEILDVTGLPRAPALETGILRDTDGNGGSIRHPKQYDSLRGELWKRLLHQTALCGTDGGPDSFHAVSSRIFKRLG